MSFVLTGDRASGATALAAWWHAWSRMGWSHLAAVMVASLLMTVISGSIWIDKLDKPGVAQVMVFDFVGSVLLFGITLLAWVAATQEAPDHGPARRRRLAWAIVVAALLSAAIAVPAMSALGIHELVWSLLNSKKKEVPPLLLSMIGHTTIYATFSFLFVAVAEVMQRRRSTTTALQATQRAQATIAREVLESRLAAMQAQVEPQFLFESLVDIETLYRRDASRAADDLDRLISYLRVALPRLRETGSTVEAEIELVQAYLAVVTSLHGGRPTLSITLPDDCRSARFYPMLLLPLLQRAVRQPSMPESIKIGISRIGSQIAIVLRFALPSHCDDDPELLRVRERLAGLFGAAASLDCHHLGGVTQVTMRVPAAPVSK
ncbi:MAG TPA: histidine kinase [Burkholderiaceae bacterium]|nr:histidine kinase [Burkholderiaceae bacterium]